MKQTYYLFTFQKVDEKGEAKLPQVNVMGYSVETALMKVKNLFYDKGDWALMSVTEYWVPGIQFKEVSDAMKESFK